MANNSNAGMALNQSSQKLPKLKAIWSNELHKTFVELCSDRMKKGYKQGTFFTKDGWNYINSEFNKMTGKDYDKKQMKNHWDNTKAEWKIWYKLKDYETGLGWDCEKNTVIASDDLWKDYIQRYPESIKFRYKGIDYANELTDLFLEGTATGKSAWAPSQGILPDDIAGPCQGIRNIEKERIVDLESNTEMLNEEEPMTDGLNNDNSDLGDTTSSRRHKRKADIIPPPEHRKKASSVVTMNKQLDRICDVVEKMVNKSNGTNADMKTCIAILNQMEAVPRGSELYMLACDLFLNKEQRALFVELEDPERLQWLQKAQRDQINVNWDRNL